MKQKLLILTTCLITLSVFSFIASASVTKVETDEKTVQPIVAYGYTTSNVLVPVKVTVDGTIYIN